MNTQTYPTDLTDRQWDCSRDLIPAAKAGGRPRSLAMRQVINAILYILVSGAQWRMLPKDYPNGKCGYHYFRLWRDDGTGQRLHDSLRAELRRRGGRHKHPTVGCLDSQSVKTTSVPGVRGYDRRPDAFQTASENKPQSQANQAWTEAIVQRSGVYASMLCRAYVLRWTSSKQCR